MSNAILVLNAGSSSIKFSVFSDRGGNLEPGIRGQVEGLTARARFVSKSPDGIITAEKDWPEGTPPGHDGALDHLIDHLRSELSADRLIGIGHRVVHGGLDYTQPEVAQMFALPAELREAGVRRYGFHGLSYEYIASRLRDAAPQAAAGRVVVLHLGNGASMCALAAGRSVASTMGFTAVEGLVMGTRCGSLDPGVILYLMDQRGMDARAIETLIYTQSGLLGVSGISSDMRLLLASEDPRARLAVDLFLYRIGRELGSLAASLGGLDAIVFTGGIGENAPEIRRRVCRDAAWLGVAIDEAANAAGRGCISAGASPVAVWVIPTNEELMIAQHTRRVLAGDPQEENT